MLSSNSNVDNNSENSKNTSFNCKLVKCDSCSIEASFKTEKDAYLAGWAFKGVAIGLTMSYCPDCSKETV